MAWFDVVKEGARERIKESVDIIRRQGRMMLQEVQTWDGKSLAGRNRSLNSGQNLPLTAGGEEVTKWKGNLGGWFWGEGLTKNDIFL